MNELKTNVTLLCNRTKTYCDYSILLKRINTDKFKGTWVEIKGATTPLRSGFTRMNTMKPEGGAFMMFQGIGSLIWLYQENVMLSNSMHLAAVTINMEVWQHAFPVSGEKMAKNTEFGPVKEPGIALFWNGIMA
jgi:hypothetical protein